MTPRGPDRRWQEWVNTVEPRTTPPDILEKVFAVTRRSGQRRGLAGWLEGVLGTAQPTSRRHRRAG